MSGCSVGLGVDCYGLDVQFTVLAQSAFNISRSICSFMARRVSVMLNAVLTLPFG